MSKMFEKTLNIYIFQSNRLNIYHRQARAVKVKLQFSDKMLFYLAQWDKINNWKISWGKQGKEKEKEKKFFGGFGLNFETFNIF